MPSRWIVTTVLATPCTAPMLGTAIAFAFAQPPAVILLVFATVTLTAVNTGSETAGSARADYVKVRTSATVYVDPAGSDERPYDTWGKAAHDLRDAVDQAAGLILVLGRGVVHGFTELLKIAYQRAKEANPEVQVLAGALAPTLAPPGSEWGMNDLDYLQAMYDAGAADYFDILAAHAYGWSFPPDEPAAPDVVNFRRTELLYAIMAANGDGDKPVMITEGGWNDHPRWTRAVRPGLQKTDQAELAGFVEADVARQALPGLGSAAKQRQVAGVIHRIDSVQQAARVADYAAFFLMGELVEQQPDGLIHHPGGPHQGIRDRFVGEVEHLDPDGVVGLDPVQRRRQLVGHAPGRARHAAGVRDDDRRALGHQRREGRRGRRRGGALDRARCGRLGRGDRAPVGAAAVVGDVPQDQESHDHRDHRDDDADRRAHRGSADALARRPASCRRR